MRLDCYKILELILSGGITLLVGFGVVLFTDWLRRLKESKREGILFELAVLRGKGVEIRNFGEGKQLKGEELAKWQKLALDVEKQMIEKANELSPVEGRRLEYLDRVQAFSYSHIKDVEQIRTLQNLSGLLIKADTILNKYRF